MSINEDNLINKIIDSNNMVTDSYSEYNEFNNENNILFNDGYDIKNEKSLSIIKSHYNQTEIENKKIKEKINKNNEEIEEIKKILSKLKEEKDKKKLDIVNLLSKKETIEEVYKNQIILLKKKSTLYKELIKNNNLEKKNSGYEEKYKDSVDILSNIINNSNEEDDQFDINIEEMKEIEINKFIEQVISMMEEIFEKNFFKKDSKENNNKEGKKNDIINSLIDLINNSYNLFNKNFSVSSDKFIIRNFIAKISIFISNQSYGKYSDNNINLFLRYLLKINVVNVQIDKMVKFVNKKYKDKKNELKNEIKNIIKKNEYLEKKKLEGETILNKLKENIETYINYKLNKKKLQNEKNISEKVNDFQIINNYNNTIIPNIEYKNEKDKDNLKNKVVEEKNKIKKEEIINENEEEIKKNFDSNYKNEKILEQNIKINEDNIINNNIKNNSIKKNLIDNNIYYHEDKSYKINDESSSENNSFYKDINCESEDDDIEIGKNVEIKKNIKTKNNSFYKLSKNKQKYSINNIFDYSEDNESNNENEDKDNYEREIKDNQKDNNFNRINSEDKLIIKSINKRNFLIDKMDDFEINGNDNSEKKNNFLMNNNKNLINKNNIYKSLKENEKFLIQKENDLNINNKLFNQTFFDNKKECNNEEINEIENEINKNKYDIKLNNIKLMNDIILDKEISPKTNDSKKFEENQNKGKNNIQNNENNCNFNSQNNEEIKKIKNNSIGKKNDFILKKKLIQKILNLSKNKNSEELLKKNLIYNIKNNKNYIENKGQNIEKEKILDNFNNKKDINIININMNEGKENIKNNIIDNDNKIKKFRYIEEKIDNKDFTKINEKLNNNIQNENKTNKNTFILNKKNNLEFSENNKESNLFIEQKENVKNIQKEVDIRNFENKQDITNINYKDNTEYIKENIESINYLKNINKNKLEITNNNNINLQGNLEININKIQNEIINKNINTEKENKYNNFINILQTDNSIKEKINKDKMILNNNLNIIVNNRIEINKQIPNNNNNKNKSINEIDGKKQIIIGDKEANKNLKITNNFLEIMNIKEKAKYQSILSSKKINKIDIEKEYKLNKLICKSENLELINNKMKKNLNNNLNIKEDIIIKNNNIKIKDNINNSSQKESKVENKNLILKSNNFYIKSSNKSNLQNNIQKNNFIERSNDFFLKQNDINEDEKDDKINKYLKIKKNINLNINEKNNKENKSPNLEFKKNLFIYDKTYRIDEINDNSNYYYNKKIKGGFSKSKSNSSLNEEIIFEEKKNDIKKELNKHNNKRNNKNEIKDKKNYIKENEIIMFIPNYINQNNNEIKSINKFIKHSNEKNLINEIANQNNLKIINNAKLEIEKVSNHFNNNDIQNKKKDNIIIKKEERNSGNKNENIVINEDIKNNKESMFKELKEESQNINENNNILNIKKNKITDIQNPSDENKIIKKNNINSKNNKINYKLNQEKKTLSQKYINNNKIITNLECKENIFRINNKVQLKNEIVQNLLKNLKNRNIIKSNESKKNVKKNINDNKDININNLNKPNINNSNNNGKDVDIEINTNTFKIIQKRKELNDRRNIKQNQISKILENKKNMPHSYKKLIQNKNNKFLPYLNHIDKSNCNIKNIVNKNIINTPNSIKKEFSKIPVAKKPFSNKISKLNLDSFLSKRREKNKSIDIKKSNTNDFRERRNYTQGNNFNRIFNGMENDTIMNGISRDTFITSENIDNNDKKSDEEIHNIKHKINYRRLNTDLYYSKNNSNRNNKIDGNILLKSNKNLSSNSNRMKIKKGSFLSNTIEGVNSAKRVKIMKSKYPLFFNIHNNNKINGNYLHTNYSIKKGKNKFLIKNFSNTRMKVDKRKQKDILNTNIQYLDTYYFNKRNKSLHKTYNYSTLVNEEILDMGLKPPMPINIIHHKKSKEKNIRNNINADTKKNDLKKEKNNNLKYMDMEIETNNNTINFNRKNLKFLNNYDILNLKFDESNKDIINSNYLENKSSDTITNNNNLKSLLEKKLNSQNFKTNIDIQKMLAKGIMESFCYFKILNRDSPKFNPLDSCTVNPEIFGYCEGYISIDVILGHLKIIPKKTATENFKTNNYLFNSGFMQENNIYHNLFNNFSINGKNNYLINYENDENNLCIRIELKEINSVEIKKQMQDIMKIHKIFLKYNSRAGMEYEDDNGRIKKRVLSINKLINMKEINEINMDQNEKIKAALCNFFAFTLIFGKNRIYKVECLFINFQQFNFWYKCLETIAENNNKTKNDFVSSRGLFHRKYISNNNNHSYKNNANGNTINNYIFNN